LYLHAFEHLRETPSQAVIEVVNQFHDKLFSRSPPLGGEVITEDSISMRVIVVEAGAMLMLPLKEHAQKQKKQEELTLTMSLIQA